MRGFVLKTGLLPRILAAPPSPCMACVKVQGHRQGTCLPSPSKAEVLRTRMLFLNSVVCFFAHYLVQRNIC